MGNIQKKTIFITISRGGIARNILQNDFFDLIKKEFDRVIILSSAYKDPRFIKEFKSDKVEIVPLPGVKPTYFNNLINKINRFLNYNKNTACLSLYNYAKAPNFFMFTVIYIKYLVLRLIFQPISKFKIIRKLFRKIDNSILQESTIAKCKELINIYKPSLIFATNIMEDEDVTLVKVAKKEGIKTISMPKSWDNISKRYFRIKSDKVIVWSNFMKEQMVKLQDYKPSEVEIVGVPQFDYYIDKTKIESRESFCKRLNLDHNKKIIFFGSEGKLIPSDKNIAEVIYDFIRKKLLDKDCRLLIRPHFGYRDDEYKFKRLFNKKDVVVDMNFKRSFGFNDRWDYSKEQMYHFLNSLFHSNIIITTCSTLALDAAALHKPSILIKFDGFEKMPIYKSARRFYTTDYFSKVLEFKAALETHNISELKNSINKLLNNPDLLNERQKKLRDYFCFKVDGKAGRRLFNIINDYCA